MSIVSDQIFFPTHRKGFLFGGLQKNTEIILMSWLLWAEDANTPNANIFHFSL